MFHALAFWNTLFPQKTTPREKKPPVEIQPDPNEEIPVPTLGGEDLIIRPEGKNLLLSYEGVEFELDQEGIDLLLDILEEHNEIAHRHIV